MPEAVHESVEVAKLLSNSQGATLIESQHSSQMRSGSTAPRLPSDAQPNAAAFGSELPGVLPSDVATRTSVDHDDKCYLSFTGDVMASVSLSLPPHSSGQQQQQQQNPHLRRQQLQPPFYPDTFLRKPPLPHDQANDLQDTASPSFPTSSELPDLIATPMSPLSEKVTDTGTGMSSRSSMAKPMNPCWCACVFVVASFAYASVTKAQLIMLGCKTGHAPDTCCDNTSLRVLSCIQLLQQGITDLCACFAKHCPHTGTRFVPQPSQTLQPASLPCFCSSKTSLTGQS